MMIRLAEHVVLTFTGEAASGKAAGNFYDDSFVSQRQGTSWKYVTRRHRIFRAQTRDGEHFSGY